MSEVVEVVIMAEVAEEVLASGNVLKTPQCYAR